VHVSKFWRGVTVAAVACGLAATGSGIALAQSGPAITISAKSAFAPVTHDVFVQYADTSHGDNAVAIKGSISGATAGDIADLYAQQFPFKAAPAPVAGETLTLSGTTASYSFTAKPTLATKYTVELFASSTATSPAATSPVQIVYVVTTQTGTPRFCTPSSAHPVCHLSVKFYTHLPASAYRTEVGKKWYVYFAITFGKLPKDVPLDTHVTVGKAKKTSATDFERTLTWSYRMGDRSYIPLFTFCSKDSESKDGINLPGSHRCGAKRIPITTTYLG
jgi:hypothetical protein